MYILLVAKLKGLGTNIDFRSFTPMYLDHGKEQMKDVAFRNKYEKYIVRLKRYSLLLYQQEENILLDANFVLKTIFLSLIYFF